MDWTILVIGIVIGAIGVLTIEHGWGWVLGKIQFWKR